ncbi:1-phosphofructokinase [Spiroplasma endosymbiont of Crioceris asparagi]|uniref:1-phosphofructokinase n=1 Tax=Spiroplasma endosymbiont of Crioceris asparagi TaxID=3066286 RepID=UPI0030CE71BD
MIYTITLNPAIDYILEIDNKLNVGVTNYYSREYFQAGGKGINVGLVLNNLKQEVELLGLLGSENQEVFTKAFKDQKIKNNFMVIKGKNRTNFKIKNLVSKEETELNGLGFNVLENDIKKFLKTFEKTIRKNDIVVITGSAPKSISQSLYKELGDIANQKGATFIVDANKELLKNALRSKPYLIKPNTEEICSTLGIEYKENLDLKELKALVQELQKMGAQNVLVSMGSKGSVFFGINNDIYQVSIAKGDLVNSVGAGDSMVAGFVYGISNKLSIEETLKVAAAAGGATAFTEWLAQGDEILKLSKQIEVNKVEV